MWFLSSGLFSRKWSPGSALEQLNLSGSEREVFHVLLIKPTRYDDDGYPIHWYRAALPANVLACLNGIALDSASRNVLGSDVEIRVTAFDEATDYINYSRLIEHVQQAGQRLLLCLVGVQSNQFPRAMDIAQPFLEAELPVCIGGFHVSGCIAMLPELPPELKALQDRGASLFAGEAEEGRFDQLLHDVWSDKLQPLYNYLSHPASLENSPLPILPESTYRRSLLPMASIDLGRGCPYKCSFCCIINVHGRKSRSRSVERFENYIRSAAKQGIQKIFITDDNFARNKEWRLYFERMIAVRSEGIDLQYAIQVDTLCHKIPEFIDMAAKAGVSEVFIGLENFNPDNLALVQKRQNKITEYKDMILQWKRHPVIIWSGYIMGFPNDTRRSILQDIDLIKQMLPIDMLYPSILTPLPGSKDHQDHINNGIWVDSDLNRYDLSHRVIHHPLMSDQELDKTFIEIYESFYSYGHMVTILKRVFGLGSNKRYSTVEQLLFLGVQSRLHGIHSLDLGALRYKTRNSRRPGLPREPALLFYPKYILGTLTKSFIFIYYMLRLTRTMKRLWKDPASMEYTDSAIDSSYPENIQVPQGSESDHSTTAHQTTIS